MGDAPLYLLAETCIERILEEIGRVKPALIVVDSVQTVFSLKFQSAPGSIGQVREAATQFLFMAKGQNIPTVLVGHVTKDGNLAGPKALEHVVDTVLYFEGERHHAQRVVRAIKNRFGAVSELGVFEMTDAGLAEVPNPSALFLAGRDHAAPGTAVTRDVPYGSHARHTLNIFAPAGASAADVLLYVHGGVWSGGQRSSDAAQLQALAESGLVIVAIDFRLAPQHPYPAQVQDVNLAVRWLKAHGGERFAVGWKLAFISQKNWVNSFG